MPGAGGRPWAAHRSLAPGSGKYAHDFRTFRGSGSDRQGGPGRPHDFRPDMGSGSGRTGSARRARAHGRAAPDGHSCPDPGTRLRGPGRMTA
ncbi:hypothetical protein GCM10010206_13620 [Streptomyces cinerochromogenes]|nr:hypothetical protein GCM10010206_13620 [Streptomyces cinerochromogenes]